MPGVTASPPILALLLRLSVQQVGCTFRWEMQAHENVQPRRMDPYRYCVVRKMDVHFDRAHLGRAACEVRVFARLY